MTILPILQLRSRLPPLRRPPPTGAGPVVCKRGGTSDCTVTNTYGSFPDRAVCRAADVTYPRTEQELVAAVAAAAAAGRRVKVVTRYSNSFPRIACPGGRDGTALGKVAREKQGVTLAMEPLFKRSVKFDDRDIAEKVAIWGSLHEFGDMVQLPGQGKVIYREDDRVDVSTPDDGLNDYLGFRLQPTLSMVGFRVIGGADEWLEENNGRFTDSARCVASRVVTATFELMAYGFTNDGAAFTGYPVVGYQHRVQASSSCLDVDDGGLLFSCPWDHRIRGVFAYNSGFSVTLSRAPAFVADVARLRDLVPAAFCQLDAKMGVLMRYVGASSAYLGKAEASPRAHADVFDEIEQMALRKYGGVPHWGKNRNSAFAGAVSRYPNAGAFLEVKGRYDPGGVFSSEWSDPVLGVRGSPVVLGDGCAMEGLCVCSDDSRCAPELGYYCRPGKVFKEASVCSLKDAAAAGVPANRTE
uniref:Uncharacterized protein n=1 Tax=Oryza brachyantha TaxID=4533 RepID=J3LX06_ORYBR